MVEAQPSLWEEKNDTRYWQGEVLTAKINRVIDGISKADILTVQTTLTGNRFTGESIQPLQGNQSDALKQGKQEGKHWEGN